MRRHCYCARHARLADYHACCQTAARLRRMFAMLLRADAEIFFAVFRRDMLALLTLLPRLFAADAAATASVAILMRHALRCIAPCAAAMPLPSLSCRRLN